jgi:hypothetical protein
LAAVRGYPTAKPFRSAEQRHGAEAVTHKLFVTASRIACEPAGASAGTTHGCGAPRTMSGKLVVFQFEFRTLKNLR